MHIQIPTDLNSSPDHTEKVFGPDKVIGTVGMKSAMKKRPTIHHSEPYRNHRGIAHGDTHTRHSCLLEDTRM